MSRRRWVYTNRGQPLPEPIEVTDNFTGADKRAAYTTEGLVHGSNVAPDGTNISTKRRRAEWMKQTGAADYTDYTQHLEKSKAAREEFWTQGPRDDTPHRDIYQAMQMHRKRGK